MCVILKTRVGVSPAEGAAETIHMQNLNIYEHRYEMRRAEPDKHHCGNSIM